MVYNTNQIRVINVNGGISMSNVLINNEINLTCPDSFKEMGEAELTRYFSSPANRWGAYDADRHIVLSVSWTKAGFKHLITDAESMLISVEGRLRRSLVNYQRVQSYSYKIGKAKASCIRFEYRVNDAARIHVGDLIVFKHKKNFYAVHFITRQANAIETRPELESILKSLSLS